MSSEDLSKSTIESIRDVILSRFKSRFTGAFIIAWIVWNWKIIYVTIFINKSEIDSNKIDYIGKHFTSSSHLLWFPLFASLIAILLIPILNGLSDNWHEFISGSIKRISMWISKRTPVDQAEFKELVDRYNVLETDYLTEIDRIKKEAKDDNDRMSIIIVELNNELNALKTPTNGNQEKSNKTNPKSSNIESDQDNHNPVKTVNTATAENEISYPSLQSVVMRNLPATESEWIIVYSFYASVFGEKIFKRQDIIDLYSETNRRTVSRMNNFSQYLKTAVQSNLINPINSNGDYTILEKGIHRAKEILGRKSSSPVKINRKTSSRSEKKNDTVLDKITLSKKSSSKIKSQQLVLVNTLDLHPKNLESLKDFYSKFDLKSNYEKNLVFVYYLQNILKSDIIGINDIYTCYKHVGERVPGNLYQSLIDTNKRKAWIDTTNMNQITVVVLGENYFEHDLKRK